MKVLKGMIELYDLREIIDKSMPVWVNRNGFSDRYDNYTSAIINGRYGNEPVVYITVNADGELVIELMESW